MLSSRLPIILCASLASFTAARSLAEPVKQYLATRDSPYQGGWPLGLSTSATDTCPADSVACTPDPVNPTCCPSGNTCTWGPSQYQFYCCPTDSDCNEAVVNFPRCAFNNQTMFINSPGGYFCCNPGEVGVTPSSGKSGGLCESSDQVIPKSLLATIVSQVGFATSTPTPGGPGNNNATTTDSGSSPAETNPSATPTSTGSSDSFKAAKDAISKWPLGVKIGIGAGVAFAIILLCVVSSLVRRRRQRMRGVIAGNYSEVAEYDEYGNRIGVYPPAYGTTPAYEPYRNTASPANNVTVNVVHGDQSH